MNEPTCAIGVDMGTTTLKAIAFDEMGRVLAQASSLVALTSGDDGAAEQDPHAVRAAVTETLARAASDARAKGYHVAQVGVSAAMHSLIPLGDDETPLASAMIWMDSRAQGEAAALWATPEGRALYERTGTPVHAMAPLAKLLWLRQERPSLFAEARHYVSLKEWVWHAWFGEWRVDDSIASATGLYNIAQMGWDVDALHTAGVTKEQLSPVVPTTYTQRGVRDARLLEAGVSPETAFVIGASDGVLANLGLGAITPQSMVMTIGTSLAVRTGSDRPVTDAATRSFCYVLDRGRYIAGGASNNGGIVLDWLYHHVLSQPVNRKLDLMAEMIDAAGGVESGELLCLPYVAGERAPLWNARATGFFAGLHVGQSGAHLMRAAIEGVIFNAYWIADGLFSALGRPEALLASGKVLQTPWIRQVAADVFGVPITDLGGVDASALGAALLARIATGDLRWDQLPTATPARADQVMQPQGTAAYREKYARFRELVDRMQLAR